MYKALMSNLQTYIGKICLLGSKDIVPKKFSNLDHLFLLLGEDVSDKMS